MSDIYEIVKHVVDQQRHDANLASEAYRESLARIIAEQVDTHVNRLIEDIVSPCGIPDRS